LLDKERDDMKKAILILILCAVFLSACGNAAETAERSVSVDTSAVSQTTTAVTVSAVTSAKEEKDTSEATTTTFKTSSQTVSETSKPTNITVTTTKKSDPSGYSGNSSQGQNNSAQNNNGQENNYQPVQNDPQPDNSPSDNNRSNNGAEQNNRPSDNKPQNNDPTPPTTTAEPAVTNPPDTTTKPQTTTALQTQPPLPVPTEEERYMDIGRSLSHNGSDYSKAEAVYNWMTENGSGTCVNYSWQTYYLCKGTGLECYLAWTPSKLYGHVANVVKVNGTWFVLDTQGQGFLLNNDCGFSEIIDIDESYVSGADLISSQRYDEIY
jgi:predicted small secreted protein